MTIPVSLTIAGSDSSGGAGIQADLKTFAAHKVYGASVITALTAQNTKIVVDIYPVSPEFVTAQIDAVFDDLNVKSVKIGMLANAEIVEAVAVCLKRLTPKYIVLDPVMVATSGDELADRDAAEAIMAHLLPISTLITPNIFEAAAMLKISKETVADDLAASARALSVHSAGGVLITGGDHDTEKAVDMLFDAENTYELAAERINTKNTHGTGCTLSSAIAANLALGLNLEQAVRAAKDYVTKALLAADELNVGHGAGPLNHFHEFWMA